MSKNQVLCGSLRAESEEELCRSEKENQRKLQQQESPLSPRIAVVRGEDQILPTIPDPSVNLGSSQTTRPRIKEEPEEQNARQEGEQLPGSAPDPNTVCVKTEDTSMLQQRQSEHQRSKQIDDSSVPETSTTENSGDMSETDNQAEQKKLQCHVCPKRFASKLGLSRHSKIHTGGKLYSCTFCKKTCVQKYNLEVHMRTHTGEKPFTCSVCEKAFTDSSNLKTHVRETHTGDTPFSCPFCEKGFCFSSDLKAHVRTHTGEKPFSCSICEKTYSCNSTLSKHMRIHAGDKPFKCSVCEKAFTLRDYLRLHMSTHTEDKPFCCSVCNNVFGRKAHLKRHMETHR